MIQEQFLILPRVGLRSRRYGKRWLLHFFGRFWSMKWNCWANQSFTDLYSVSFFSVSIQSLSIHGWLISEGYIWSEFSLSLIIIFSFLCWTKRKTITMKVVHSVQPIWNCSCRNFQTQILDLTILRPNNCWIVSRKKEIRSALLRRHIVGSSIDCFNP